MQTAATPTRFIALDGVRGVAAIAVVLFHYSQFNADAWLARAWVAVDIFVCLSGFVIAHTYQKKLAEGMPFSVFFGRRLNRLYPLYLFGLALGAMTFVADPANRGTLGAAESAKAFALGVFVLPYLNGASVGDGAGTVVGPLFPFNGPAWSMFFELVANAAFFALVYLRAKRLGWVIGTSALLYLLASHAAGGLNGGWSASSFVVGFPRVVFSFMVGVLIYRLRVPGRLVAARYGLLCVLAMLLVFVLPGSRLVSLLGVLALGPLVVWTNAGVQPGPRLASACAFLGAISYPLYITHVPVFRCLSLLASESGWAAPAWLLTLGATALAVLAAWCLSWLDEVARRRTRRLAFGTRGAER
ncbi:MAG: hypothetical protein V7632_996 [Bradyrhizobium sp.]|jgi:peptidoglycan/LPS O-acetylase OafA/YrhL